MPRRGRLPTPQTASQPPRLDLAPSFTPGMIGHSPAIRNVIEIIESSANSTLTVLIHGESGTGKERVARALHRRSGRRDRAFVALNMAATPFLLIESELFGHARGAFTAANSRHCGRSAQADGGSLFLDEIGDMPLELLTRLLRVLEDGEFFPIGAAAPI